MRKSLKSMKVWKLGSCRKNDSGTGQGTNRRSTRIGKFVGGRRMPKIELYRSLDKS